MQSVSEKVNKKKLKAAGIIALIFVGALALLGILEGTVALMTRKIDFIHAGERWSSGEERYAVVSMYCEENAGYDDNQIIGWARGIDSKLLESSVTPPENGRSWAYCYAAEVSVNVSGPKGNAAAETMAVGGDFAVFHRMDITYGSFFLNDDSNPMGVVLDRDLAWKVFGAENVVGMTVTINEFEFTVVGICDKRTDRGVYGYTYGTNPRMYMSYAGYAKVFGESPKVTLFETALPNSVKSFAKNIFNSVVSVSADNAVVIESSDRFSISNRYKNTKNIGYSWIKSNKIEYPYWENEAKVYDYRCAIIMQFEVVIAAIGIFVLLLAIILFFTSGYSLIVTFKSIFNKISLEIKKHKKTKNSQKIKKKE